MSTMKAESESKKFTRKKRQKDQIQLIAISRNQFHDNIL